MVRHVKLPDHLYLSPPPQSPSPQSSSYLSFKSSSYSSPGALLSETSGSALAVSDHIPGFRTSATFLNSLRANLRLADEPFRPISSATPSLTNTPDSLRPTTMTSSMGSLGPPSPSPLTQPPSSLDDPVPHDPINDIPPLTISLATSTEDKVAALRLIADSVAQQRQFASKALIFHPVTIAVFVGLLAVVGQWLYKGSLSDFAMIGTTYAGLTMAGLITVRWATGGYITLAEEVGTWAWLDRGSTSNMEDDLLITKYGEEPIGALVLRGVKDLDSHSTGSQGSSGSTRKRRQNSGGSGGSGKTKGVIRGWSTKYRYRGKGVGTGLLEEAVKVCAERGWSGPEFAADHANTGRILPTLFNSGFERRDKKAREMLSTVLGESSPTSAGGNGGGGGSGRRKGGGRK